MDDFYPLQIIFLSKIAHTDAISWSQHTHSLPVCHIPSILKEMKENSVRWVLKSLNYYGGLFKCWLALYNVWYLLLINFIVIVDKSVYSTLNIRKTDAS